ncbi:MAG: UDP-N-acetylmuramate dehydrogenase [Patescibacteria group bacterium]
MKFHENIPLSQHTTFKIGGTAQYFFPVETLEEMREAVDFAREKNLPFFILGGGSNLLVSDSGFKGVVIKNQIKGVAFEETGDEVSVKVGAGENWDTFVESVVVRGLFGLENLSGIPGTVGAAPVQNIGAYGVEVKETIMSVETLNAQTGEIKIFSSDECRFAYRDSFFKTPAGKSYIILAVNFHLKKNASLNLEYKDLKNYFALVKITPTIFDVRRGVLEIRGKKFPDLQKIGTAGSFFKNPIIPVAQFEELKKKFPDLPGFPLLATDYRLSTIKISLAWILDNVCNMKGLVKGSTGLFERQPIVLVNLGGADAKSVTDFALEVTQSVKEKTGIDVEWEVQYLD